MDVLQIIVGADGVPLVDSPVRATISYEMLGTSKHLLPEDHIDAFLTITNRPLAYEKHIEIATELKYLTEARNG
jgi:hypothetical protein